MTRVDRFIPVLGPEGQVLPRWKIEAPDSALKPTDNGFGLQLSGSSWRIATFARILGRFPNSFFTVKVDYESNGVI